MPKLSSGRHFFLLLPNFTNPNFSVDAAVFGIMLSAGVNVTTESLKNLVPIGHLIDASDENSAILPTGLVVQDILDGRSDWSAQEIQEFSEYIKDWVALNEQLNAAAQILPHLGDYIRKSHALEANRLDRAKRRSMSPDYLGGKHGYAFCFFDVLGFESKIGSPGCSGALGVKGVESVYRELAQLIIQNNIESLKIEDKFLSLGKTGVAPLGTADGDFFLRYEIYGMYISDSFCFWMDRNWPVSLYTILANGNDAPSPFLSWAREPIPPDNLLELCNEAICRSIELGLPLRGAITSGHAALRPNEMIFLGEPIVEAARMEKAQNFIGASFAKTFVDSGLISNRFLIPYSKQIKKNKSTGNPVDDAKRFSEFALDWPLHWRATRKECPRLAVESLQEQAKLKEGYLGDVYSNTVEFIAESEDYESRSTKSRLSRRISDHYPYFNSMSSVDCIVVQDK